MPAIPMKRESRGPLRSTSRPTIGPAIPAVRSDSDTPKETAARDHPNCSSKGSMKSPNDQNETPLTTPTPTKEAVRIHQP